jgi:CubicO group peptidase (beta-lactamase class C family)
VRVNRGELEVTPSALWLTGDRDESAVLSGVARVGFVLFLLCWLVSCRDLPARIEQIPRSYARNNQFMGAVLVAEGDRVIIDKGYGYANIERQEPNTPDTKFRLGSITKQFTAACVLLLEERGKLKTYDVVNKYIPNAPRAWGKITIFHLLTHMSGIPNFTSFPDYPEIETRTVTPEQLVALFRDKPLDFEPGTRWNYSNSGYALLGYLIEKVSGNGYQDFVRENILEPVGMKDSGYDSSSAVIARHANGYTRRGDAIVNANYIDMTIPYAAGGLYSTTHDLLRWEHGLFGGKVLSPASLNGKMTTPFQENYAMGLRVIARRSLEICHGGDIEGLARFWPISLTRS